MPACRPISSRVSPSSARRWATRRPKSPRTSLGSCVLPIVPPNFALHLVPAPTWKWVRPKKDVPIVDLLVSAQVAVEALGGPGRFVLALDLDPVVVHDLYPAWHVGDLEHGRCPADQCTERNGGDKPDLVHAVVDRHRHALDHKDLAEQRDDQGQGQMSVGDGTAEGA